MSDLLERIKLYSVWIGKDNSQEIIDLIEQQQARIAELEVTNKALEQNRDQYKREAYALAATVERLREQLSYMSAQHQCGCGHPACNRCRDDADNREVLRATPHQNLNTVKREVAREAFVAGFSKGYYGNMGQPETEDVIMSCARLCANKYANTKYPSDKE